MSLIRHWPARRGGRRLSGHAFPAIGTALLFVWVACFTWLSLLYYPCLGGKPAFDIT